MIKHKFTSYTERYAHYNLYAPSLVCEIAEEPKIIIQAVEIKQTDGIFLTNRLKGSIKIKNVHEKHFDNFKISNKFCMI